MQKYWKFKFERKKKGGREAESGGKKWREDLRKKGKEKRVERKTEKEKGAEDLPVQEN